MVTTNLQIQDSGYRQVPSTGSETDVTNSGTAIDLKSVSLTFNISAMINDESTKQYVDGDDTNKFTFGEVDKNGLTFPSWKVEGILDMGNATDRTNLAYLYDLVKTKGYKKLLTTDDANNKIFLRWTNTTPVTSINVRLKGINIKQTPDSDIIQYSINAVETN
jgi:hypothetical protein